jgi:iron complex transport system substrate-binding protein
VSGGRRRDASGVEVALSARPTRIVSLIPSITETLFALGLEERIVGVTRF